MSSLPPDLPHPEQALEAVAGVSLRLMAGTVSKKTMDQLQRTLQQSSAEFPWQVVTQAILAEPGDPQKIVQQGLRAQRDWILRGGREVPGRTIATKAKGMFAKLCAQMIFLALFSLVLWVALLLLKHKMPEFDLYKPLHWIYELFPSQPR